MSALLAFIIWTLGAIAGGGIIGSLLERRLQARERALLKDDVAFWRGKADEWQRLAEEERKSVEQWQWQEESARRGWGAALKELEALCAAGAPRPVKPKSTDVN